MNLFQSLTDAMDIVLSSDESAGRHTNSGQFNCGVISGIQYLMVVNIVILTVQCSVINQ